MPGHQWLCAGVRKPPAGKGTEFADNALACGGYETSRVHARQMDGSLATERATGEWSCRIRRDGWAAVPMRGGRCGPGLDPGGLRTAQGQAWSGDHPLHAVGGLACPPKPRVPV